MHKSYYHSTHSLEIHIHLITCAGKWRGRKLVGWLHSRTTGKLLTNAPKVKPQQHTWFEDPSGDLVTTRKLTNSIAHLQCLKLTFRFLSGDCTHAQTSFPHKPQTFSHGKSEGIGAFLWSVRSNKEVTYRKQEYLLCIIVHMQSPALSFLPIAKEYLYILKFAILQVVNHKSHQSNQL